MGLDIKKLREMQKGIKKKAGQGDGIFLYSNKIEGEIDVRLLPPKPNMNGVYFLEQTGWWVNGKFVLVDEDNDVIENEISEARASKDKTLIALIEKKKNNMPLLKRETRYLIPILLLKSTYNDDELVSCEVEDVKVLIAKPTMLTEINALVTARPYQNGTKDGIADRVKGFNIILTKEGKGLNTAYKAIGWTEAMEMPEKYYEDKEVPDILDIHQKSMKSEEYQISVIRNYLYGEDIIEDDDAKQDEEEEEVETPKKSARPSTAKASSGRPAKATAGTAKSSPRPQSRSLLDDAVSDMEDM